jgi:hypothetical protein
MGRIIKPGEIRQQCNSIIQAMQRENQQLQDILPSIRRFLEESTLEGAAWDGLKSQVEGQQSLIQGLICANEELIADSECLANSVGDEDLDEDEITRQLELARMYMGSYQEIIDNYEQDFHFHSANIIQNDFGMCNHCRRQIRLYTKLATTQQQIIRRMEEKLQRIIDIENATKGLYQGGTSLYASYEQGLEALKGNWNGSEYGVLPYAPWQKTLDERWNLRQEKKAEAYLLEEGVTQVQIDNMKKLGYSVVELKMQWEEFETKEDKEFYLLLMTQTDESFAKAFRIDPNKLSGAATMAMANYAVRIVDYPEILQGFNQGILDSSKMYINPATMEVNNLLYRDVYMERLIAGLSILSEMHSVRLTSHYSDLMNCGITPEDNDLYNEAYGIFEKCLGLQNFFIAQDDYLKTIQNKEFGADFSNGTLMPKVINIKYNAGAITADFSYFHGTYSYLHSIEKGDYVHKGIETSLINNPIGYARIETMKSFERIHKERENLIGKYILSGGKSIVLAGISLYGGPMTMMVASGVTMMAEGSIGIVANLDTQITSGMSESQITHSRLGIKSGNILVKEIGGYFQERQKINNKLLSEKNILKMEWFGTGGAYEDAYKNTGLSFVKIQDPKIKYYIGQWEKEGISSWMDVSDDKKQRVLEILEENLNNDIHETIDEEKIKSLKRRKDLLPQIVNGGFNIEEVRDKEGNILKEEINMEDFLICIQYLYEKKVDCHTEWIALLK